MAKKEYTEKELRFISEYCIDGNGCRAYKAAGYKVKTDDSAKANAYRMLHKERISEAIAKKREQNLQHIDVSAQYVLNNLKAVVERCVTNENFESKGAVEALKLLGNYLGLWEEKTNTKVTGDGVIVAFNMVLNGKKT